MGNWKGKEMDSSYVKIPWDFLSFFTPLQESVNGAWEMNVDVKR